MVRLNYQMAVCGVAVLIHAIGLTTEISGVEPVVDKIMFLDPEIDNPQVTPKFSGKLKPLWLQALGRPESELRRLAADSITQAAPLGLEDFSDASDPLTKLLTTESPPIVRRSAARALVTIEARKSAKALQECAARDGLLMAQIVEPALARWGVEGVAETWLSRLLDVQVESGLRTLAMLNLASVKENRAVAPLVEIIKDDNVLPEVRNAAARACGQIANSGLNSLASELLKRSTRPPALGAILAVQLLAEHSDDDSIRVLHQLAIHSEPAVSTPALRRLHKLGTQHSTEHGAMAIASADAGLRQIGAQVLVDEAKPSSIEPLAKLLGDRNPTVRRFVAAEFVKFAARPEFNSLVIEQSVKGLQSDDWRTLEQAALVVGALDHEASATRLLELLPHKRTEPAIAVSWALRKLRVKDVLPQMLAYAQSIDSVIREQPGMTPGARQASQLFQAFGVERFREAEPLMRTYVPKNPIEDDARCAAIWALGYFYEGQDDQPLATQLADRLADVQSIVPETEPVRRICAVTLGRMKARSQLDTLRIFSRAEGTKTAVGFACNWAIRQITGEETDPPDNPITAVKGWFLEPIE